MSHTHPISQNALIDESQSTGKIISSRMRNMENGEGKEVIYFRFATRSAKIIHHECGPATSSSILSTGIPFDVGPIETRQQCAAAERWLTNRSVAIEDGPVDSGCLSQQHSATTCRKMAVAASSNCHQWGFDDHGGAFGVGIGSVLAGELATVLLLPG